MKKSELPENLFSEFKDTPLELWEDQIKKDLNWADYKEVLKWHTLEGFTPMPFYALKDIKNLNTGNIAPGLSKQTLKTALITESEPSLANKQIKEFIDQGVTACLIKSRILGQTGSINGHLTGTQIHSLSDLNKLLKDLDRDSVDLIFDTGAASPAFISMLKGTGFYRVRFIYDPISYIAQHGRYPLPPEHLEALIIQFASKQDLPFLAADCLPYHMGGATIVQELAIMLATASDYFSLIDDANRTNVAKSFITRLSAGPLYFPEIAKIRAARLLWSNLLGAYGLDPKQPLFIHSETTPQNKTVSDAYNNLLRSTTEAMSAIIGGSDSVLVLPHDINYQKADTFSNRMARNILHISEAEAHLNKTIDPSAGSYYIENLTNEIAEKAWGYFKEIEKRGGLLESLQSNLIQNDILDARDQKLKAYATIVRTLTGTNHYPNSDEELPDEEFTDFSKPLTSQNNDTNIDADELSNSLKSAFSEGASIADVVKWVLKPQKVLYETLTPLNPGQLFDDIKRRTQKFQNESGHLPVVTMVSTGNKKWSKARANFASNIFGCAGFVINTAQESFEGEQFDSNLKSDVYVLCGSDADYEKIVSKFCDEFADKGLLILAGNPKEKAELYTKTGIDHFMMKGMDVIQFLTTVQDQLFKPEAL